MDRITAHYYIETPYEPAAAAEVLAGEQSSGTFVAVPGETADIREQFRARVESVQYLETVSTPAIPGAESETGKYHRAMVRVSWNTGNFGYNLPVLTSTLQGNLYEIRQFTGLKLMDIDFPDSYTSHFRGPAFGIGGTRKLMGVDHRPMIGTIIKPSVGLTPEATAGMVNTLAAAGLDFVKDDELLSSSANSSFEARVTAVMEVVNRHADKTGRKMMYACNISGEMDDMLRRYELLVKLGCTSAMISINSTGMAAVQKITGLGQLSIHAHRNGWGMLTRHPLLGIDFNAYQKIWRLAGVDQLHVNGIQNKFWETDDSVVQSMEACLKPLNNLQPLLPVVSSGQWGGQAFETWRRTKTTDLLYMAGGGIMGHPGGAPQGVLAIQQAWTAAVDGLTPEQAAEKYPAFKQSVQAFGTKH